MPRSGEPALQSDKVLELLRSDNKIGAIKLMRELSKLDLKAAKEAVEALEREAQSAEREGMTPEQAVSHVQFHLEFPPAAQEALRRGDKVQAIKVLRLEKGLALKEAKDAVDAYYRLRPDASQGSGGGGIETGEQDRVGAVLFIVLLVVAALVYYFFFFTH